MRNRSSDALSAVTLPLHCWTQTMFLKVWVEIHSWVCGKIKMDPSIVLDKLVASSFKVFITESFSFSVVI